MKTSFQTKYFSHTLDMNFSFKWQDVRTGHIIRKKGILNFERYKTSFGREKEKRQYAVLTLTHSFDGPTPIPMTRLEFLWKVSVEIIEMLYKKNGGRPSKEEFAHSILTAFPIEWGHVSGKSDNLYFTPSVRKKLNNKLENALADWLWFELGFELNKEDN